MIKKKKKSKIDFEGKTKQGQYWTLDAPRTRQREGVLDKPMDGPTDMTHTLIEMLGAFKKKLGIRFVERDRYLTDGTILISYFCMVFALVADLAYIIHIINCIPFDLFHQRNLFWTENQSNRRGRFLNKDPRWTDGRTNISESS